jgi:hypothetical protein
MGLSRSDDSGVDQVNIVAVGNFPAVVPPSLLTIACRARERSLMASCRSAGTHIAVSSPARDGLAKLVASRRFVFTRSPGFLGISEGATTMHSWPRLLMSL